MPRSTYHPTERPKLSRIILGRDRLYEFRVRADIAIMPGTVESSMSPAGESLRKPIQVLVGDCSDNVGRVFCDMFSDSSDGKIQLELTESLTADGLLGHAELSRYDIALIILNNMIYGEVEMDLDARAESGIALAQTLIERHHLPVIVLIGAPNDNSLLLRLREVGVKFAAFLPVDFEKFLEVFRTYTLDRT
jgi:hypothetical protein